MLDLYFGNKNDRDSKQKSRDEPPDMLLNDKTDISNRDNYGSIENDVGAVDITSASNLDRKNSGAVNNVF